mgnify:CR=1 FL=1
MTTREKYPWLIGCPPPRLDRHSQIRHRIIDTYLRAYILAARAPVRIPRRQLTLVEGHAGGGAHLAADGGEVDGSPLLVLRAVRAARLQLNQGRQVPREVTVDYHFVADRRETAAYLEQHLRARAGEAAIEPQDLARARVSSGRFQSALPRIIAAIAQRRAGERAIFLLDQSNCSLPIREVATILGSLAGAEVLLTFDVGALVTFIAAHTSDRAAIERLGLAGYIPWGALHALKTMRHWRRALQRHLAHGIRQETGARFATLYFMRSDRHADWDGWLIHLTNHYKAHEIMKDLHWAAPGCFGHELEPGVFVQGYDPKDDATDDDRDTFDFGETARRACIDGIHEDLGQRIFALEQPTRLRDLIASCATRSPGSTEHFLAALNHLHQSRDVIISGPDGRVRDPSRSRRYHLDSLVERGPIIRLIP